MIAVESYRQAIRNNQILTKILITLTVVIVALVITIISLFSLKTTEYKLYEFSSSGHTFFKIDSAADLVNRSKQLVRMLSRNYVTTRETIDRLTEQDRFFIINEISSSEVFKNFKTSYSQVNKAIGETGKRKVIIELDNPFNNDWTSKVHIVEFSTEDQIGKQSKKILRYWKAVIGYKLNQQKIRLDDLVQNPLGVEITNYSITQRNPLNKLEK